MEQYKSNVAAVMEFLKSGGFQRLNNQPAQALLSGIRRIPDSNKSSLFLLHGQPMDRTQSSILGLQEMYRLQALYPATGRCLAWRAYLPRSSLLPKAPV